MTQIDRYILVLFARTVAICFFSLASVFVVFHAFNNLDAVTQQGTEGQSIATAMASYYGPYMLMLFDWTASIITLIAMLFTVSWLRRSGELTALLSAGINHGRILRPMIAFSAIVVVMQTVNREYLIPPYRDLLTTKPGELAAEGARAMLPSYDKSLGILIEGDGLRLETGMVERPRFRLFASYPGYGDVIAGTEAVWVEADGDMPSGYLVSGVTRPALIDQLPVATVPLATAPSESADADLSVTLVSNTAPQSVIWTHAAMPSIGPGECFVATTLNPEVLRDNPRSTRMAAMPELVRRVRNPSVHSSDALRVMLHERILRGPLDFCLVLLGLPLVVNRGDRRLFSVIGQAMGIVLLFFGSRPSRAEWEAAVIFCRHPWAHGCRCSFLVRLRSFATETSKSCDGSGESAASLLSLIFVLALMARDGLGSPRIGPAKDAPVIHRKRPQRVALGADHPVMSTFLIERGDKVADRANHAGILQLIIGYRRDEELDHVTGRLNLAIHFAVVFAFFEPRRAHRTVAILQLPGVLDEIVDVLVGAIPLADNRFAFGTTAAERMGKSHQTVRAATCRADDRLR